MKKNTFKLTLIALLIIVAWMAAINVKGQSTCATAVSKTQDDAYNYTTYSITGKVFWVKFNASYQNCRVKIKTSDSKPNAPIKGIYLYSGACSSLIEIIRDSTSNSDSLIITANSLIIGNNYYIKVTQSQSSQGYFDLCINNVVSNDPPIPLFNCSCIGSNLLYDGDFSLGLAGFPPSSTDYVLESIPSNGSWNGSYDITTDASLDNTSWTGLGHGGGTGNYFMAVDIGLTYTLPSPFSIWKQTVTVTPSTNYNFSFWVNNLDRIENPDDFVRDHIQLYINNTPIIFQTTNLTPSTTLIIPILPDQWVQVCGTWNSGPSITTANIQLHGVFIDDGGNDIGVDDIQFGLAAVVDAGNNQTICSGQCATLTATGASSYSWSNGSQSNPTVVCPTSTTTYTVTGTISSGCTASDNVTVTVNPNPNPFTILGDSVSCGSYGGVTGQYSIQSPQTGVIYTWSGPSGMVFTPTQGTNTILSGSLYTSGYITVTASNGSNCTTTSTKFVFECCYNHGGTYHDYTNSNASAIIANYGNNVNTTDNININGVLTIDQSITFTGCPNIYMGRDAEIIITAGRTLTLQPGKPNITHIQSACNYMWDGIIIPNNTAILHVYGGSIIEDANYAIVSQNGGEFDVTGSILRNNYRDIIVQPYSGTYNSHIYGSTLSCPRDLYPTYPPYNLHERTNTGITITELATTWTIGDATASANKNTFDNMWYGIKSSKTNDFTSQNLSIVNNLFTNINTSYGGISDPSKGVAVYYTTDNNSGGVVSYLTVGGTGTYSGNYFGGGTWGCNTGIECFRKTNTTIRGNTFTRVWNGIYIDNVWRAPVNILYNTFDNISGIGSYAISTLYTRSALSITYNNINAQTSLVADMGISVSDNSDDGTSYTESSMVNHNTIRNAYTGIFGTVPSGYTQPTFGVNYNTITMPLTLATNNYGIRIESCVPASVANNTVTWGYAPNSGNVDQLQGIRIMSSTGSGITTNTLTNMGSGIRCSNVENPTNIACNIMNTCYYGVYMESTSIGNQGQLMEPNDNQWIGNINAYRVFGTLASLAPAHTWYYANNLGGNYTLLTSPLQYSVTGGNGFTTIGTPSGGLCTGGGMPISGGSITTSSQRQEYLGIDNTGLTAANVSAYTDESEYFVKKNAYYLINKDTSILSLGLPDDNVYRQFYNRVKSSNIGKFDKVAKMISNEMYVAALTLNSSIAALNQMETNAKTVNNIFLNTWAKQQFALTSADS
jgi:hypothetical protein